MEKTENNDDLIESVLTITDDAVDNFDAATVKIQRQMLGKVLAATKDLTLDSSGRIKQTIANNKVILRIQKDVQKLLQTPSYQKAVKKFLVSFDELAKANDKWAKNVENAK